MMKTIFFFGYCEDGHPVLFDLKYEYSQVLTFLTDDTMVSDMIFNEGDEWTVESLRESLGKHVMQGGHLSDAGIEEMRDCLSDICQRGGFAIVEKRNFAQEATAKNAAEMM